MSAFAALTVGAKASGQAGMMPLGPLEAWQSSRTTIIPWALHNTTEAVPHSFGTRSGDEQTPPCR